MSRITILDATLRDGSHAVEHQHTLESVTAVVSSLDEAGVDIIEVAHGDGLGGSSVHFGFGREADVDHIGTAVANAKRARISALLVPGLGTTDDLRAAAGRGLQAVRIATHVTETDLSRPHIAAAKELGLLTVGFMMMTHMAEPERIAESARMLEGFGADIVYLADSAGYMLSGDIQARVAAVHDAVTVPIGVHTHNNLGYGIANALAAADVGATYIDGTLCGLGAGAGNAQLEVLVATLERAGYETNVDLDRVLDAAETVGRPLLPRPQVIDAEAVMIGTTGVYSSFLLPTRHAAEIYGVPARAIYRELGKHSLVAGQEDMIVNVAYELARELHGETAGD